MSATRIYILCLFMSLPSFSWAASSIVGTLTDPSGAAVAGATVIVCDPATGSERRVGSNFQGEFVVAVLPPGRYQITILKPGFRKTVSSDIELNVEQTLRVDEVLQLGEVTTQVEVNS